MSRLKLQGRRMSRAYIGLGSNKDDRVSYLNRSLLELEKVIDISVLEVSSIYESKPFGVKEQPNYLNAVVLIETLLKIVVVMLIFSALAGLTSIRYWPLGLIILSIATM